MPGYKEEFLRLKKNIRTLPLFLRVFGIFLSVVTLGTGARYMHVMVLFKIQLFTLIHLTNKTLQNTAKQSITTKNPLAATLILYLS